MLPDSFSNFSRILPHFGIARKTSASYRATGEALGVAEIESAERVAVAPAMLVIALAGRDEAKDGTSPVARSAYKP